MGESSQGISINQTQHSDNLYHHYCISIVVAQVYTINQESKYLIVLNVPALGVVKELLAIFHVYGEIEE